jgi:hypothetical protein
VVANNNDTPGRVVVGDQFSGTPTDSSHGDAD